MWVSVAPGGKLLLTNAHLDNPTRVWMEWVSEWYLDYKTQGEFRELADELDQVAQVDYEIDTCGVYQYLSLTKG